MKLITKAIEKKAQRIGRQDTSLEQTKDREIIAKFFNPSGSGTWYAIEIDIETRIAFGWVAGLGHDELGYFSIDELESVRGPFGLGIERDRYFGRHTLREVLEGATS